MFRHRAARDFGYLLDVDPSVISWTCLPMVLDHAQGPHVPDFAITRTSGTALIDVLPPNREASLPPVLAEAAPAAGHRYETITEADFPEGLRLDNARDLLRYANYHASLGDRVRLLTLLEEQGPEAILSGAWTPPEGVSMRDVMGCRWDMPTRLHQPAPGRGRRLHLAGACRQRTRQRILGDRHRERTRQGPLRGGRAVVHGIQSADCGAAAAMAAAIMAGDNEPTEIEKDVAAIEEAALADEVEKVAPAEGAKKPRRKPEPAPTA
ncbi:hypothetical protein [Microvirga aerophila]|uniref:Uncharacterized protein n=1 Tax=Microvirga aerophila TaxID=670291 RepID=A0A512C3Q5_9HYPH|nr:hypothetical protein [Microvirga aerophila]GEO18840.1 hypothetical protein MAE02_65360 [Microvirga aerophila]